ncbi:MAG: SDR family NAD(P)-dependent oxidoreductase [Myxococcales bacterium]|nr:SDR family NAD(P)-dependent oxidoreductase [Myxococcales bacterium]MCB9715648.1 SDR family NAD(P)-dependent oxidoreductase [Myxococcales bacterium]
MLSIFKRFKERIVVITGAGSGIGRATARAFAEHGARLHLVDIHAGRIEEAAQEARRLGPEAHAHQVDVRDAEAVERLAAEVYRRHRRVDVLVNNAGVGHSALVHETSLDDWRWVLDVNLWGVIHGIHAFVPRLIDQGGGAHIVNTASIAGLIGLPSMAPYSASKFAVVGLSEALGAELAPHGITVTAVCPGVVSTDIIRSGRIEGALGERRRSVIDFYDKRGLPPERVARDILRAVRSGAPLATPLGATYPALLLRRLSPRLYRSTAKLALSRVIGADRR